MRNLTGVILSLGTLFLAHPVSAETSVYYLLQMVNQPQKFRILEKGVDSSEKIALVFVDETCTYCKSLKSKANQYMKLNPSAQIFTVVLSDAWKRVLKLKEENSKYFVGPLVLDPGQRLAKSLGRSGSGFIELKGFKIVRSY